MCQPWFMDVPLKADERDGASFIDVVTPPAHLKPRGDFKRLLSEYKMWVWQNRDKGYGAPLRALHVMGLADEPPWEIRQMVRQMGENHSPPLKDNVLKWHLILHLARESEENRVEAEEMLQQVKAQESPLKDALGGEAPVRGLFEDLPQYDMSPSLDERYLRQVFEAWFGLFAECVPGDGRLVTLDRNVLNYARELFQDKVRPLPTEGEGPSSTEPALDHTDFGPECVQLPPDDETAYKDPILAGLLGKTIILFEPQESAG
jgi:hypothetical protein